MEVGRGVGEGPGMRITYDPESDALYIILRDVVPSDSSDVEDGVTVELDDEGHIVALEVLDASARLTPDELGAVKYERLKPLLDKKPQPTRRRLARPIKTR
jgi:uncharacterized protein YuzE